MAVSAVWKAVLLIAALAPAALGGERGDVFLASRNHPAIRYDSEPPTDAVTALNERLGNGSVSLDFDEIAGYLPALLRVLDVPVESQLLVFSRTSFQAPLINFHNPRAIYFSDSVAVGWVRGGAVLEVAAQDPRQGVIFFSLDQKREVRPQLTRNDECLACHLAWETRGVPGLMMLSVYPVRDEQSYVGGSLTVQGTPLEQRWGGWWVTGDHGGTRHMGNVPVRPEDAAKAGPENPVQALTAVDGQFDMTGYPARTSDVVALLVMAHQAHMINLLTRAGWEARLSEWSPGPAAASRVQESVRDLVDYMLFIDEAPFPGPVVGTAGFAEKFAAAGPRDREGRSLREFDLRRRLFRYPCSYMIHSPAFDALPSAAKEAAYARLWEVLSGAETAARYQSLSVGDREAVVAILRDTKVDLPAYFRAASEL